MVWEHPWPLGFVVGLPGKTHSHTPSDSGDNMAQRLGVGWGAGRPP